MTSTGGCLCGAIRFEIPTELLRKDTYACHCKQCRVWSGNYVNMSECPFESLSFVGEKEPTWFESSPKIRRGFCGVCGSVMFWHDTRTADIAVSAGSIDEPSGLKTKGHIFCKYKGDYYSLEPEDLAKEERMELTN